MAAAIGTSFATRLGIAAPYHTAGTIPPLLLAASTPSQTPSGRTGSCAAADCFLLPPSPALSNSFARSRSLFQVAARF